MLSFGLLLHDQEILVPEIFGMNLKVMPITLFSMSNSPDSEIETLVAIPSHILSMLFGSGLPLTTFSSTASFIALAQTTIWVDIALSVVGS